MHPYRTAFVPTSSPSPPVPGLRLALGVLAFVSAVQLATASSWPGIALGAACLAASVGGLARRSIET